MHSQLLLILMMTAILICLRELVNRYWADLNPGITIAYRNTGTANVPVFTLDNTLVTGIPDIGLNSYPTFADLDNDEDYDLVFGRDLQTLVYYRNTGTKQSPVWTQNTTTFSGVETTTYWKNPTFSDLDYDGDFDLIYGTDGGVLYVYRNIGTVTTPSFQYYPDYFKIVKLSGVKCNCLA